MISFYVLDVSVLDMFSHLQLIYFDVFNSAIFRVELTYFKKNTSYQLFLYGLYFWFLRELTPVPTPESPGLVSALSSVGLG